MLANKPCVAAATSDVEALLKKDGMLAAIRVADTPSDLVSDI